MASLPVPLRREAYRLGFQWAIDLGRWTKEEMRTLDMRYREQAAALAALLGDAAADTDDSWGGERPARVAAQWLRASAPLLASLVEAAGHTGLSHPPPLLAHVAHMSANRLGIEGTAEAILRYFAFRHHHDPA
jgi:hypothetical protein